MEPRAFADFGGRCLVGELRADAEPLLPDTVVFGIPKSASYLIGTWRDEHGSMLRALRGVEAAASGFAFAFSNDGRETLERIPEGDALYRGASEIRSDGDTVTFSPPGADDTGAFWYRHAADGCAWREPGVLDVRGDLLGPGVQWFHPWKEGGGGLTATLKYASEGTFLGRPVTGFVAHEIHYFPVGVTWTTSRYGAGMEICWQHMANEYEDGTFTSGTFATGTDGWGFAMVHDEDGRFHASTDVEMDATVGPHGYPARVTYAFLDQEWTWEIDPRGERARTIPGSPLGADGTFRRAGERRRVLRSLGNSDWWDDGRYEASRASRRAR